MAVRDLVLELNDIEVDTRERIPYIFPGLFYWRRGKTTEVYRLKPRSVCLKFGDMRLASAPRAGVIERKRDLREIYANLTPGGATANRRCHNFLRELDRMAECSHPAILLDFSWDELWVPASGGPSPFAILDRLFALALPRGITILGPQDARTVRKRQAAGDFILRYLLAARDCPPRKNKNLSYKRPGAGYIRERMEVISREETKEPANEQETETISGAGSIRRRVRIPAGAVGVA